MKTVVKDEQITIGGKELNLSVEKNREGYYREILEVTVGQLDAMLSHHSRVLVVRLDLHLHEGTVCNKVVSEFIAKLRFQLGKSNGYNMKRLGYIWCREQNKSSAQHYHLALYVDANKCRHPKKLIELVQCLWDESQIGFTYVPKNCYYIVNRIDEGCYMDAFQRLSYLAKVSTKGERKSTTNDFSSSRIKPRVRTNQN